MGSRFRCSLLGQHHGLGRYLGVRLAAIALDALRNLAIPGRLELENQRRFLELSDGAEHLPHQNRSGRVLGEMIRGSRWDEIDTKSFQVIVTSQLHRQITGKPIRALDCRVIEPVGPIDDVAARLGIRLDCRARGEMPRRPSSSCRLGRPHPISRRPGHLARQASAGPVERLCPARTRAARPLIKASSTRLM